MLSRRLAAMRYSLRRAALVFTIVTAAGVVAAEIAHRFEVVQRGELFYYDLWHRIAGVRFAPRHVALVTVDELTLAEYHDTPLVFWTPLFAKAAARLREAGATVVAFDFIFSTSPGNWLSRLPVADKVEAQDYDIEFRQEIASGRLALAASRLGAVGGVDQFLLPAPEYVLAVPGLDIARHVGLVDLVADDDGGVRRFQLAPRLRLPEKVQASEAPRVSLAALIAVRALGQDPHAARWRFGGLEVPADDAMRHITYAGPPGTFPSVSLRSILADGADGEAAARALKGKTVVVGANYSGMNDVHFTPYASGAFGRTGHLMPGPELHANIAESLLADHFTDPLADAPRLALFVLFAAAATLAYLLLSPWAGFAVLALAAAAAALAGYGAFNGLRIFPTASLQVGLAFAYVCAYGLRLTREERERSRIARMFGRYVSPQVVDELVATPALPELGGSTRNVTVLFADIRGFTTISEKLSAREVVEMLNSYFEHACGAVLAEGGTIDKYIGDAIMAEFGAPLAQPDHARRAVRAALALHREAREFREWMRRRFPELGLEDFDIGIGLHTGEAVVGNIGSSQRMEYTAIGDMVNTASRLEGATKELGCSVLASRSTIESAGAGVRTGKFERIHVKGRSQPVEVFEVLGIESTEGGE